MLMISIRRIQSLYIVRGATTFLNGTLNCELLQVEFFEEVHPVYETTRWERTAGLGLGDRASNRSSALSAQVQPACAYSSYLENFGLRHR